MDQGKELPGPSVPSSVNESYLSLFALSSTALFTSIKMLVHLPVGIQLHPLMEPSADVVCNLSNNGTDPPDVIFSYIHHVDPVLLLLFI